MLEVVISFGIICFSIGFIFIAVSINRLSADLAGFLRRYKPEVSSGEKYRFIKAEPGEPKEEILAKTKPAQTEVPQIDPSKFAGLKKPPRAPGGFGMVQKDDKDNK